MANLLWTLAIASLIVWLLGVALHSKRGGLTHLLLVLALITALVKIVSVRRLV